LSGCVVSWGDLSRTANPKVGIRRKRQASRLSDRWRQRASQLKREVYALHFAVRDPSGAVVRQGPCGVRRRVCRQPDRPHSRSHPGPDAKLAPLIDELRAVVRFAGTLGELARDEAATASWRAVYGTLTREEPGMVGTVIGRAEVQVLRLSILYAVLDRSKEVLTPHLLAALALWEYAKASARRIFGDRLGDHVAEGDSRGPPRSGAPDPDRIARDLRSAPISGRARGGLGPPGGTGQARCALKETEGRPAEVWEAIGR
jgi:hypothetical protein